VPPWHFGVIGGAALAEFDLKLGGGNRKHATSAARACH